MKLNKRKCKYIHCDVVFQKKRSLDMFCSPKCHTDHKKWLEDKKGGEKKKHIAPVSEKRLKQLAEYRQLRKDFLSRPENHYCPVLKHFAGAHVRVTEIHHKNGRENERLNDTEFWLAVSRQGHNWIHSHPEEARKMGWLI